MTFAEVEKVLNGGIETLGLLHQFSIHNEQALLEGYEAIEKVRDWALCADDMDIAQDIGAIRRRISDALKPLRVIEIDLVRLRERVTVAKKEQRVASLAKEAVGGGKIPEDDWLATKGEMPVTSDELKRICSENPYMTYYENSTPAGRHRVANRCGNDVILNDEELGKLNHGELYRILFGLVGRNHPKRRFFSMGFANDQG